MINVLRNNKDQSKRSLFYMLLGLVSLFASFSGNTHALQVLRHFYPESQGLRTADLILMILAAIVSVCTAIIGSKLFPVILKSLNQFELSGDGSLQHVHNYLVEVVEIMKEGVFVLSENMKITRCNEASKTLLNTNDLLDKTYTDFIHPSDLHIFHAAVVRVLGSYNMTPVTIEYRVNQKAFPSTPNNKEVRKKCARVTSFRSPLFAKTESKVHAAHISEDDSGMEMVNPTLPANQLSFTSSQMSPGGGTSTIAGASAINLDMFTRHSSERDNVSRMSQEQATAEEESKCVWIEATICKGMNMNENGDFEYDLKVVCRDIEDRKRAALREYDDLVRETEERNRTNAAKLRYISCIAHDLKTPLQSFCFTLDLLNQTHMRREQREYVQQANVAVDLMRLTISQTMDISKALTGAKLMPRRTTVNLSTVMSRVEIIINGYGKQVPVIFKLARDVCDRIITDEEWLWQMVLNLLTNACKYTDRGEIHVAVTRTHGSATLDREFPVEMLLVEVVDTGVGVGDDKLGSMFEAFAQVQEGQVTGTGLGLFGVRTRAEGLQGTCGARHNTESSTGTGTAMWFAIPYVPDELASISQELSFSDEAFIETSVKPARSPRACQALAASSDSYDLHSVVEPDLPLEKDLGNVEAQHASIAPTDLAARTEWLIRSRKLTAVVIDDTKTVCKLMERLLMKMGFESVVCYENGSKGLEAMMAGQVDIVFSDVQMPIMTGPEMVRRFRLFEADALSTGARSVRQLIVAVTANGSELSDGGSSSGFDQVCPKPLSVKDIYQLMQKYFQ